MTPTSGRSSTPDNPWITILEFLASERPEQLKAVLSIAEDSPARSALLQLAKEWGTQRKELPKVAVETAATLDRFESRQSPRLTEHYLARLPHLVALLHFATERHERVTGGRRRRRLRYVRGRLEAGLELARRRRQIDRLFGVPAGPSAAACDPRWLQAFIGR